MNIILTIIYFLLMFAVAILLIMLFKKFLFSKVRINKYIPLALSIVGIVAQLIMKSNNFFVNAGFTLFVILTFAWYFDINQTGGPKKGEKQIVIKSKAKPNRVKKNKK